MLNWFAVLGVTSKICRNSPKMTIIQSIIRIYVGVTYR